MIYENFFIIDQWMNLISLLLIVQVWLEVLEIKINKKKKHYTEKTKAKREIGRVYYYLIPNIQ